MIQKETTIITGAGASVPYGYPTSGELREWICNSFIDLYNKMPEADYTQFYTKLFPKNPEPLINEYEKCDDLPFDMYITRLKCNSEKITCMNILKTAIWFYEISESKLHPKIDNWIASLFISITNHITDCEIYNSSTIFERIRFITFNYDRLLEYKLHSLILNYFRKPFLDKQSRFINVYHMYNIISDLEWSDSKRKAKYQFVGNNKNIDKLIINIVQLLCYDSNDIGIMHTNRVNNGIEFENKIKVAENIYFLGFGFAEENLKALDSLQDFSGKKIYGTAYGMSNRQIENVKSLMIEINNSINYDDITLINCNCSILLKEYPLQ